MSTERLHGLLPRRPAPAPHGSLRVRVGDWLDAVFPGRHARRFRPRVFRLRPIGSGTTPSPRSASPRAGLLAALRSNDEAQVLLALRLGRHALDAATWDAIRECLAHASPVVRAAAVEAMDALRLPDPEGTIERLIDHPDDGLRRAVVRYMLSRGSDPVKYARRLLDGSDASLRQHVLEVLEEQPYAARGALTWAWIDARMKTGRRDDLVLAARALAAMDAPTTGGRLRSLLSHPDPEVRRAALVTAARRPSRRRLDVLIPLLIARAPAEEVRRAVEAVGDPAVADLQGFLDGHAGPRAQAIAARVLSQIATPRAVEALMTLVRSADPRTRHVGLQAVATARIRSGRPVVERAAAHRLFLRELRDYRTHWSPAAALERSPHPEVRLLAESSIQTAHRALERALEALATWYDPRPLRGLFERLKSGNPAALAPAIDYLGHILPKAVFRPVARLFEAAAMGPPPEAGGRDRLAESIRNAWETGDAWLQTCAVRAARHAPSFDRAQFATGATSEPTLRAEIEALARADRGALPGRA